MPTQAGLQLLCLLLALHPGRGLQCFESACLSDPASCGSDERLVLRKCHQGIVRDLVRETGAVPFATPLLSLLPMMCLKHVVGDTSYKMCFPKVPKLCSAVGYIARKLLRSEQVGVVVQCHACDSDACNGAAATSGIVVVVVAIACSSVLLTLQLFVAA
ncbi:uncharacterized protein LOC134528083 [Bacillus rossius redtenbacheri]|uniref:uncharacterized protein LOC134528083 n=1 Tax=Bacillus rossius redtenbacheri TaxID=93214 RepID=UPI002FDCBE7E